MKKNRTSAGPFLSRQLQAAAEIWKNIEPATEPADRWLGNYFHRNRQFGSRNRRFLAETIYSAFRHKTFIAAWMEKLGLKGDAVIFTLFAAACEEILTKSEFKDSFEDHRSAEIYESLNQRDLAQRPESEDARLSVKYSFPLWLVRRWQRKFGSKLEDLLTRLQTRPPLAVRTNTLKISRDELLKKFRKLGYEIKCAPRSQNGIIFKERGHLFDTEAFRKGYFEIQDEGSQILCETIRPKPGETLWDVCAGGGGKSLALAALMKNKGRIVATDIRSHKLDDLRKRAARAGVNNIFPAELERIAEAQVVKKGLDKILVDAPCSGTGTLRRNPDAKWKLKEEDLIKFHQDQTAILEKALPYLKKGGVLYYATCSLEAEENEAVMEEFISKHPEIRLKSLSKAKDGFLRLYPHLEETDGFFLAAVEKYRDS